MVHSSLVRMRWKPPGRWSTQSLRGTTRPAPTGAEVGGRKRLTRLSLRTAVGTTPYPRRHPDDVPAMAASPSGLIAAGQHAEKEWTTGRRNLTRGGTPKREPDLHLARRVLMLCHVVRDHGPTCDHHGRASRASRGIRAHHAAGGERASEHSVGPARTHARRRAVSASRI